MAKRQEVVPSICRVFKTVLPIGQIRLQKVVNTRKHNIVKYIVFVNFIGHNTVPQPTNFKTFPQSLTNLAVVPKSKRLRKQIYSL